MMESLAVVNAGASSELLWSMLIESIAAIESALWIESRTARRESEMTGMFIESRAISLALPLLKRRLERLSSCEDNVKELSTSSIRATSPHFSNHVFNIPLFMMDINN